MMRGTTRVSLRSSIRAFACTVALVVLRPFGASAQQVTQSGEPTQPKKPFAAFSASASSVRDSLVALARAQIGRRYVLGGQSPERGFDCSGLVRYVMMALHLDVPRTAAQQSHTGLALVRDTSDLKPGDLLTFGSGRKASHVGIYVGDGRYVHASSKAGHVIESSIFRPHSPLIKVWRGARRVVLTPDSSVAAIQRSNN